MYPGFHIGLALIPPWAMQEYRPYRAHLRLDTNPFALLFWSGVRGVGFLRIKCIFAHIKEKKYGCNHDKEYGV